MNFQFSFDESLLISSSAAPWVREVALQRLLLTLNFHPLVQPASVVLLGKTVEPAVETNQTPFPML